MKKYLQTIMLSSCFCGFVNCNSPSNNRFQKDARQYYDELSKVTGDVKKQSGNLIKYFQVVAPLAKADPNYQLSQDKIDSFQHLYSSFSSCIFRSISKLRELGEFSEKWHMASLLTTNYEIIHAGYDSAFPVYLQVYAIGWLKASSSQKETIMNASKILNRTSERMKAPTDSFGVEIMEFVKKYKIKY